MSDRPDLMSRDEVAALLGVDPDYVRKLLSRYGVEEQRGYPRADVEAIPRAGWRSGQGRRTDLSPSTPADKEHRA